MTAFLSAIFGDPNERAIKALAPVVEAINRLESEFEKLSDEALKTKTAELKEQVAPQSSATGQAPQSSVAGQAGSWELDAVLAEAFAAVREASKRTLGQRHFDVQLMGGMVLHQGKIAEMRTGEGKTLVATLPAYLNALTGKGVHIVTVNDYLSRRDAVWMGQIYHALGLSVGVLNHEASYLYDPVHGENQKSKIKNQNDNAKSKNDEKDEERDIVGSFKVVHEFLRPVSRKEAYAADITYGTNNEYGFDYLRDNMAYALDQKVQRGHYFAIVDEVDSILIDEARTPLIISAPDEESGDLYRTFARFVPRLKVGEDFTVDEKLRAVAITDNGIDKVEGFLGKKLYEGGHEAESVRLVHHLEQALKAHSLYLRDRDYVVKDGEVIIVDEFTGRLMPGRRWSEGLHQAVEAKEGVEVQRESRTLATITFQNYFRMYEKLAGMTGTAATNAEEFHKVYKLDVVSIPTHRPNVRTDKPDLVFRTEKGKFMALAREIKRLNELGAPILIGTVSIEKNERLSEILKREGISHSVLNAKNHEAEAQIIAQAGKAAAVTVATNMAGRGVDIILGGNPQNDPEQSRRVTELGGLHVFGTERHEARRIDNQLRGRGGRQGDPGFTQFYLSLEDDLMRIFGSNRIQRMMESFGIPEDQPIEHRMVGKAIESAQAKIEGFHFDARKHVLEFDDVMNKQREAIYRLRVNVLESAADPKALGEYVFGMIEEETRAMAGIHAASGDSETSLDELKKFVRVLVPGDKEELTLAKLDESKNLDRAAAADHIAETLKEAFEEAYKDKETKLGEKFRETERIILLQTIDYLWVDHLTQMDHLRDSVRLRAYGQRDPLVEYKNESVRLFRGLQGAIRQLALQAILRIGAEQRTADSGQRAEARPRAAAPASGNLIFQSAKDKAPASSFPRPVSAKAPVGRNDPCPCGAVNPATGEVYKYKKCGLISAPHHKG